MKKKVRDSRFELLRIITMFWIVIFHIVVHGTFPARTFGGGVTFFELIFSSGMVANATFVILTGYFSVYQKKPAWRKLLQLLGQLYTAMIFVGLFLLLTHYTLEKEDIIHLFFPFDNSVRFVETYLWLLMIIPFLNHLLHALPVFNKWLITLSFIIVGVVIPEFFAFYPIHNLLFFAALYLLGGVYRQVTLPKWVKVGFIIPLLLLSTLSFLVVDGQNVAKGVMFTGTANVAAVCLSMAIIILVDCLPSFSSQWLNRLSSLTLGIYIFHDNNFIRPILHQLINFGQVPVDAGYRRMIVFVFSRAILVFFVAALVELIRKFLFDRLLTRIVALILPEKAIED